MREHTFGGEAGIDGKNDVSTTWVVGWLGGCNEYIACSLLELPGVSLSCIGRIVLIWIDYCDNVPMALG